MAREAGPLAVVFENYPGYIVILNCKTIMFGRKLFSKKQTQSSSDIFWNWFIKNKDRFRKAFDSPEKAHEFLDQLIEQMQPVHPSLKALAGPYNDKQFELVIT